MKPAPFAYHRPETLAEALDLMAEHGDDCKALAGGQSLLPLLAMRLAQPAVIVDLGRVPELRRREGGLVGAMVTNTQLERDPAAEWPALALLLEARLTLQSRERGRRSLAAAEFMKGPLTTALAADELLTEVSFPAWPAEARWGFAEVARRPGDFALAGAACTVIGGRRRVLVFATGRLPQLVEDPDHVEAGGDLHASAGYRKRVAGELIRKVLQQAGEVA